MVNHYTRFHMHLCLLFLYITLFACHFIPPCEVGEGILYVSLPMLILLTICLYFILTYHLH